MGALLENVLETLQDYLSYDFERTLCLKIFYARRVLAFNVIDALPFPYLLRSVADIFTLISLLGL